MDQGPYTFAPDSHPNLPPYSTSGQKPKRSGRKPRPVRNMATPATSLQPRLPAVHSSPTRNNTAAIQYQFL